MFISPKPTPTAPAPVVPTPQAAAASVPIETPAATPNPAATPAPAVPAKKDELRDIHDDIARILKDVKLPERRRPRAAKPQGIPLTPADALAAGIAAPGAPATPVAQIPPPSSPPPGSAPIPAAAPSASPAAAPEAAPESTEPRPRVTSVHTLKQDLQQVVRDQKISLVRAAALEQDRDRARDTKVPATPAAQNRNRRTIGMLFAIFMLFLLGGAALFGVYVVTQQRTAPVARVSGPSLIFAEQEAALPLDGQSPDSLKRTVAQARNSQTGALGSITRIVPLKNAVDGSGQATQRPATLPEFFAALGIAPPEDLMRALGAEFFFGFHTIDKTVPVLVIPVSSYTRAFAGMLAWEKTMNPDLAPMFTAVSMTMTDQNGLPSERTFGDYVLRNYDIRALKDDTGTIQLYYSFPTPNILVIAESPYTFTEVLSRLQASRKL